MTPAEAKQLCIEAHKGQWRRPIEKYGETSRYAAEVFANWNEESTQFYTKDGHMIENMDCTYWDVYTPYSTHPIAVASLLTSKSDMVVAYLHDLFEDTSATLTVDPYTGKSSIDFNKKTYSITPEEGNSLGLLTHEKGHPYVSYIREIVESRQATRVKLADIYHNLSDNPSEAQKQKYMKAIPILLASL